MNGLTQKWIWGLVPILVLGFFSVPARAEQYPGVYTNGNSLVFIQADGESGDLTGIVVLSYEYSMDWIITAGGHGTMTDTGLMITGGNQYVYYADGTRRSEIEFSNLDMAVDWEEMVFQVLPSYGYYLAPMVQGGLAYALVETRSGLPSQLVLAREAFDTGETINLFDGFLYQLSDGELTAQIAFTETAFGSQGLVHAAFPPDFPPPPDDYPYPYPDYPIPSYPPPQPDQIVNPATDQVYIDPTLPQGAEISPDEITDRPHFSLEPIFDYDYPELRRIGLVEFRDYGDIEGYSSVCNEMLQEKLEEIDGIEVVYIPYDSSKLGGLVIYDRAVWLCEEYGVDALLLNDLNKLEMPGGISVAMNSRTARVNLEIGSELIEGTGGSSVWEGIFEAIRIHDAYEIESGIDSVIRVDLFRLIGGMVDELVDNGALDGGHIE